MRQRVREVLDGQDTRLSRWIGGVIIALVLSSSAAIVMETVPGVGRAWRPSFSWFERVTVMVFTVEYVLRVWSAEKPLRKLVQPMMVVDLVAIAPFYLGMLAVGAVDLRFLRLLRSLRILRVLKLQRYSDALTTMVEVVRQARHQLLAFLMVAILWLVLMGSLMYNLEPETFESIPHAIWWSVVTLTTVGYGDVVPTTGLARLASGFTMMLGVGVIAIPTGILSSGMTEYYHRQRSKVICDACELGGHARDATYCRGCGASLPKPRSLPPAA